VNKKNILGKLKNTKVNRIGAVVVILLLVVIITKTILICGSC
jgi:hypothetical protein